jgi:hypothetical protein
MKERKHLNLLPSSRKSSQEPELHAIEFVRISVYSTIKTDPVAGLMKKWQVPTAPKKHQGIFPGSSTFAKLTKTERCSGPADG